MGLDVAIYKKLQEGVGMSTSLSYKNANDAIAIENIINGATISPDELYNRSNSNVTSNEINNSGYVGIALEINTWSNTGNLLVELRNYATTGQSEPGSISIINADGTIKKSNYVNITTNDTWVLMFPTPFDFSKIKTTVTGTVNYTIKYKLLTHAIVGWC